MVSHRKLRPVPYHKTPCVKLEIRVGSIAQMDLLPGQTRPKTSLARVYLGLLCVVDMHVYTCGMYEDVTVMDG